MINIPSSSSMGQSERDKIKTLKQEAAEESFDGRRGASCWGEFQKFEKEVKFKIRTELDSLKKRGEESIKRANDSVAISSGEFEKIKAEQEIKIQEIKLEGMRLGEKAQEIINILSKEIQGKIKKEESPEGTTAEDSLIQDEIGNQIVKIKKMYAEFLGEIEKNRKKIDELLFNMENNLREVSIKKAEEE